MKYSRLALVPACLVLASCLASCAVVDALGPRPNGELIALAQQAEADSAALGGTPAGALRSEQAAQLWAEISRVCGTDAEGNPPRSCAVEHSAGDSVGAASVEALTQGAPAAAAAAAPKVPAESVDMVVAQAVDAAALAPAEPVATNIPDASDVEAAREMLRREYAAAWALGVARSFADADTAARIAAAEEKAEQRREFLAQLLDATGDVPVPAPGYEFGPAGAPTDAASAAALTDEVLAGLVAAWRAAAADASSPEWMAAAIVLAARAQH